MLTISAMAALECCAAEKIMSSAPSKGAEPQSFLETCSLGLGLPNGNWGRGAITTTRHNPTHAGQHSECLECGSHPGWGPLKPLGICVIRFMT